MGRRKKEILPTKAYSILICTKDNQVFTSEVDCATDQEAIAVATREYLSWVRRRSVRLFDCENRMIFSDVVH